MLFSKKKKKNDALCLVIKDRPGPPKFTDLPCFYRWWLVTYDDYHCKKLQLNAV